MSAFTWLITSGYITFSSTHVCVNEKYTMVYFELYLTTVSPETYIFSLFIIVSDYTESLSTGTNEILHLKFPHLSEICRVVSTKNIITTYFKLYVISYALAFQ